MLVNVNMESSWGLQASANKQGSDLVACLFKKYSDIGLSSLDPLITGS